MNIINRTLLVVKCLVLSLVLVFCLSIHAQTFGLPGYYRQQLFGTDGTPLTGAKVYTCQALAACPGTPQASYTDATGSTPNSNPVIADASGVVSIWLNSSLAYKIVIQDMNGVTVETIDNVNAVTAGGGSGGTNYWTLNGSTISNNNGSSVGPVSVGGNFSSAGSGTFAHGIILNDTQSPPNTVTIIAPNCEGTLSGGGSCSGVSATWRWPTVDAAGCMQSDGVGNLSFQPCGSGGGGSAVGPTGAVQLQGGAGAFAGTGNLTFVSQLLTVTAANSSSAGIAVATGFTQSDQGFLGTTMTCITYNCFQAPGGGMAAKSFSASNYIETGNSSGVPAATSSYGFPHAGAMYCDTTSSPCTEQLYNGSAWVALASGGATSPGGSSTDVQFNSSGSFGGSGNLTYAGQLLTSIASSAGAAGIAVGVGYFQSDSGLLVTGGINPSWQNINVPTGGVYAKSIYAQTYITTGNSNTVPTPTAGQPAFSSTAGLGTLYCNGVAPCTEMLWNGSAWVSLGSGGGGSGPCGPAFSIQFNNSGTCGGSANFTYASGQVTLAGTGGTFLTMGTSNGFNASQCTNFDCIQAKLGGLATLGASVGGANGQKPVTVSLIGTSGGGSAGSQRAAIGWDTAGGGTPLWQAVSDTTAAGNNNWGLYTSGANVYAISGDYSTGNVGVHTNASGVSGLSLLVAGINGTAGIDLTGGFIQTDGGLSVIVSTNYDSVNTVGGYRAAVASCSPTPSCLSTGAFTVFNTKVIDWGGNVFANNLTVTGTCTGCTSGSAASYTATNTVGNTFLNSNGNFTVDAAGDLTAHGVINSTDAVSVTVNTAYNSIQTVGGFNADSTGGFNPVLSVRGFTIIDGNANANFGGTLAVTGTSGFSSAATFNGGLITGSSTNSTLYIGTGAFYTHVISGASTGISCSGVNNGYLAVTTSDNYLVVCDNTGTRYRAALIAY